MATNCSTNYMFAADCQFRHVLDAVFHIRLVHHSDCKISPMAEAVVERAHVMAIHSWFI